MAIFAQGAQVFMGDGGAPETFNKIPGPTDFSFTPPQAERVDVTNHDSAAREYLQGLGGEGEITTEFFYDPAEPYHLALRDKSGEADPTNFELRFKSGTIAYFAATVQWTVTLPVGDAEKIAFTLAISGAVTFND